MFPEKRKLPVILRNRIACGTKPSEILNQGGVRDVGFTREKEVSAHGFDLWASGHNSQLIRVSPSMARMHTCKRKMG